MLVSHRHRFIFIKTRKTAGTSLELSLSRYLEEGDVLTPTSPRDEHLRPKDGLSPQGHHGCFNPLPELLLGTPREKFHALRDLYRRRRYRNHMPGFKVRARVGRKIWDSYYKFCFERNPWDKSISHYYWQRERYGEGFDFKEYLRRKDFPSDQHRYIRKGRLMVDFVGRFESLKEDLERVCTHLGIPFDGWLPRAKGGVRDPESRPYQRFLDDRARRLIEEAFAPEIELLGYRFEEPMREPTSL